MRHGDYAITGVAALCLLGLSGQHAFGQSNEDRLRDALRQSVMQMRAAQDQAAQAQADAQKAQQDKAALQTALDAANARVADAAAKPAAPPAALAGLQAEVAARRAQVDAMQQALAQARRANQQLAEQARGLNDAGQRGQAGLQAQTRALDTCKAENRQLISVSEDILHLYEKQDFRSLLLRSYEPLIGTAKVRLENMVQDYDDKIHNQEYVAGARPH